MRFCKPYARVLPLLSTLPRIDLMQVYKVGPLEGARPLVVPGNETHVRSEAYQHQEGGRQERNPISLPTC